MMLTRDSLYLAKLRGGRWQGKPTSPDASMPSFGMAAVSTS